MQCTKGRLVGTALAVGVLTALGATGADATVEGTVTAVEGEAAVGADRARLNESVVEGEEIVTEEGASCSVLLERSSLIQFCGQAAVRVRTDVARNATILDVQRGTTRALVEKRPPGSVLEIHTPVAIAEIRGTVVSVTVDPATGDSTFALEEGELRIGPRDPSGGAAVTLEAGQQVTFRASGGSTGIEPLRLQDVAQRASCLDDFHHRATSAQLASAEHEPEAIEAIIDVDIEQFALPPVGAGEGSAPVVPQEMQSPTPLVTACGPVLCDSRLPEIAEPTGAPAPPVLLPGAPPSAPGGTSLPGEHGQIP